MPTTNMIDLYHGNGPKLPNFAALKARGVLVMFHKISQGSHMIDPLAADRIKAARDAGILVGGYHFMDASDASAQSDHFLSSCAQLGPLELAADFEDNNQPGMGGTPALHQLQTFMQNVDAGGKVSSIVYSSNLIRETLRPMAGGMQHVDMIGAGDFFRSHRLWLAEYGPHENIPWPWSEARKADDGTITSPAPGVWSWQFSERGAFTGILSGHVDCNYIDPAKLAGWASIPASS